MKLGKKYLLLSLIILFFVLKGIYFIFLIPPWEAPDEGGHVKYVTYIYLNHRIPMPNTSGKVNTKSIEESRSSQYQILNELRNKVLTKKMELFDRQKYNIERGLDNITFYPPLYYLYLVPFYSLSKYFSSYSSVLLLRFGSLILGTLSIILIFKISEFLFPKSKTYPLLITFLVSLQSMFTFVSSIVNNDSLVILFFIAFIYFGIKIINSEKYNGNELLILTALTGLAPLSKPQLLITIPLFGLILLNAIKSKKKSLLYFVSSIILPLIWYIPINHLSFSKAVVDPRILPDYSLIWKYPVYFLRSKQLFGIFVSFWGDFGWLNIPMQKWIYILFLLLIVTSLFGWLYLRSKKIKINKKKGSFIFIFIASVFLSVVILIFDIFHLVNIHLFSIQGRYFLPLLPFLIIFIVKGFLNYKKPISKILIIFCLIVFISSQVEMYFSISKFYYGKLPLIPPLISAYK